MVPRAETKWLRTLVCLLILPTAVVAQTADGLSVRTDPRIELVAVVFRLAGSPEYNMGRVPAYVQAIDSHFAAHREHPAVIEARRLRDQRGIGFDAVMSFAIHIDDAETPQLRRAVKSPDESLERRWSPAEAERFATLLAAFVRDTRSAEFMASQRATLDTARTRMERVVRASIDIDAIQKFFGRAPAGPFIMVPLVANAGGNFGVRYRDGAREEVFAVIGTSADNGGWPAFDTRFVPTMVHEFSHSFVNPAVEPMTARFRAAGEALYRQVEEQMRAQAYGDWTIMVNESIVRASVARYMLAHGGEEAARQQVRADRARGFYWMDELFALFAEYDGNRAQYPTLEAFLPRVADFFEKLTPRLDGRTALLSGATKVAANQDLYKVSAFCADSRIPLISAELKP
jgi:hypothetical protein